METIRGSPHHSEQDKDKRLALTVIGSLMLAGGVAAALLGPLEIYCYYLFSPGGPFHYEGFAFGSFMFGNITAQIAGYYLLAIILIPLGYGHLRRRRWIRPVALALLQAWLVVGAPLTLIAAFILAGTKELFPLAAVLGLILIVLVYPLLPILLIRFYRSPQVQRILESRDGGPCRLDTLPGPLLTLSVLYLFLIIALHILTLFNGIFPLFGRFLYGLPGIALLDLTAACLALITWGTLQRRLWAWWGALLLLGLLALSTILSFCRSSYPAILQGLAFPQAEIDFLSGIPLTGFHLALLAGISPAITWIMALLARRHFRN
ncbi:MAG: hypothetical protein GX044_03485 [Firmicutes bacterium]|nr:hypothetical protein [Bacillota bacterium]